MGEIETIKYKGFEIKLYHDEMPMNPRTEWDNFGCMVCIHNRYDLGDSVDMEAEDIIGLTERPDVEYFWLFLLDHSGLWLRTGNFACDPGGWDTSRVGIIYCTHEMIKAEYDKVTKATIKKAREMLQCEVETYSQYLEGQVYGFVVEQVEAEADCNDSCWGFYGWDYAREQMVSEAKESIDYAIKQYEKKEAEVKGLMLNCWAY